MHPTILNKLELDVMQANELLECVHLAFKHCMPAIVVHPTLSEQAMIARGSVKGKFKIITPIDVKGESYGMDKFRGLSVDSLEADGFEFTLAPHRTETDVRAEAMLLTDFTKRHLVSTIVPPEIRFVIGTQTKDVASVQTMCKGLLQSATPAMVRTDSALKTQVSKANADVHMATIQTISEIIRVPIKISGNICDIRTMTACNAASRFAVNLQQAQNIIKEHQQPDQMREILNAVP